MMHVPPDAAAMTIIDLQCGMLRGMLKMHLIGQLLMKSQLNAWQQRIYLDAAFSLGFRGEGIGEMAKKPRITGILMDLKRSGSDPR